jgi:hypothetical protein
VRDVEGKQDNEDGPNGSPSSKHGMVIEWKNITDVLKIKPNP